MLRFRGPVRSALVLTTALLLTGCEQVSGLSELTFSCFAEPESTTCAGVACGEVVNNCGEPVLCPSTCTPPFACNAGGVAPNTCGCTGGTNWILEPPEGCELWEGLPGVGNAYYTCAVEASFHVGRALCQGIGTDLAIISSPDENMAVRRIIPANVFLGLWDEFETRQTDDFVWVDGSAPSFTRWAPGEPNNSGFGEHCVEMMKATGTWNDIPCAHAANAVLCETTCPALPAPETP
ncbi:lectin-like protein [Chondromyces crocatus]|uniref:C-type lectin domain-containing protein n=1 Tax=Chondromyces crocatus TaxID=52 RepID=A0A0K1EMH4_CHOCO|nr:lectin-like protein [Chondromyces crocatus]AKT41842.1 uncharacterized protein CMC5_060530 [Chondromyces crocatus]